MFDNGHSPLIARPVADVESQNATSRGLAFISSAPAIMDILAKIKLIAQSQASVLITGESGTGKEVIARFIHSLSDRADKPYVGLNCAALPRDVIENELFGHEKEAFTGAVSKKMGCFELAQNGTLFLDEVAEMHPQVQAKFLRALELKSIRRLGGHEDIEVDARIVAATNKNIPSALTSGELRSDVYYRLSVVEIHIPALRERREDVPLLIDHFIGMFSEKYKKPPKRLSSESMQLMMNFEWPGNVRELKNVVESLMLICPECIIEPCHLPARISRQKPVELFISMPIGTTIEEVERILILRTLALVGDNKTRAAQILGISRKSLYDRLNSFSQP